MCAYFYVTDPTSEPLKWWDCVRTWIPSGASNKCRTSQRETSATTNRTQWWRSASSKLHLNISYVILKKSFVSSDVCTYTFYSTKCVHANICLTIGCPFCFISLVYSLRQLGFILWSLHVIYKIYSQVFSIVCLWSSYVTSTVFYNLRKWSLSIIIPLQFNA
jgi:hypothetical protein